VRAAEAVAQKGARRRLRKGGSTPRSTCRSFGWTFRKKLSLTPRFRLVVRRCFLSRVVRATTRTPGRTIVSNQPRGRDFSIVDEGTGLVRVMDWLWNGTGAAEQLSCGLIRPFKSSLSSPRFWQKTVI